MSTDPCAREPSARRAAAPGHGKKRGRLPREPAFLVWCLPNIVNWEGNYILDTNTFLIVIMPRKPLAFSSRKGEKGEGIRGASLLPDLEVQV